MPKPLLIIALAVAVGLLSPSAFAEQYVVVVLDDSGSMDDRMRTQDGKVRRIVAAKQALLGVLEQLPDDTQVGVLALNSRVQGSNWIVPLGASSQSQWRQNIESVDANGGTPLGEFMRIGADQLMQVRTENHYGTYRLLIVTDGEANDQNLVDQYLPDILSRGVLTDVIGVDMKSDHSLATRVHNYRRADDKAALEQAISEVFAETSQEDDGAAADFEMLAGLPDEFAAQAIQALAVRGNDPIGAVVTNSEGGTPTFSVASTTSTSQRSTGRSVMMGGLFCCFAAFGGIFLVAMLLLTMRNPRRRR